ncbi:unnamed protein product, partial [Allacma fusca]
MQGERQLRHDCTHDPLLKEKYGSTR